jgi:hypothetical protein
MTDKDNLWNAPISRVEVIGPDGREYVRYFKEGEKMQYSLQDDNRTLKIFIEDKK